jgi:hypothetical protein
MVKVRMPVWVNGKGGGNFPNPTLTFLLYGPPNLNPNILKSKQILNNKNYSWIEVF